MYFIYVFGLDDCYIDFGDYDFVLNFVMSNENERKKKFVWKRYVDFLLVIMFIFFFVLFVVVRIVVRCECGYLVDSFSYENGLIFIDVIESDFIRIGNLGLDNGWIL